MSETETKPEVRYTICGGIYGKPYTLTLHGPSGEIQIKESKGRDLHSQFMKFPKGPIRDEVVKAAYEELLCQKKNS